MIVSKYKLNGEYVTEAEFDRHMKAKRKKWGNPTIGEPGYEPPYVSRAVDVILADNCDGKQYEQSPGVGNMVKKISESKRPGCTRGAKYLSQLAKFAGDPDAWVKDEHDIRRAADIKGCDIGIEEDDGLLKHKCRREVKPKPPVALNPKIVKRELALRMARDPSIIGNKAKIKRAKEDIYNTHTPRHKRHLLKG